MRDMNSELRPSETISVFVSGGRKNYVYSMLESVTGTVEIIVCKFSGITLNYNASRFVNFEVIRDMILGGTGEEPNVLNKHTEKKIKRKRKGGGATVSMVTEPEDKLYRNSFFNRRRLGENASVPFGYK